ncbi:hypothetical protein PGT21_022733 [Puccinia graminis f. sp. tritici]|uniref:Uncharacterized protein n=2 Tax=Puccinia graminis f. sp. tritici TaxID=56615 RepID=E3KWY5_PUCGT|nr:uncharacterized protein PGTG_14217 [Puccinia graminis f. sp. tritici CRL 75-36-700-3]EFP88878.1 hypothetical protein PGTG_14217 [Puccinia graminis f. sp. tritici CRL 75-36-700-3]KAA1113146.1 hypothetical protein PGT21_022733 [Puccinia graminis f. sp. tritici]KAA1113678.1 hypothetical protein PGTUg99_019758 [Puccinia graminis f. sp. tritici]
MRFACATAGVLVLGATVSQARSIAPSPWSERDSTESEAVHFGLVSQRSTADSDDWNSSSTPQNTLPLKNNDDLSAPSPKRAGSGSAQPSSASDSQDDSESSSRVHEYSQKDYSRERVTHQPSKILGLFSVRPTIQRNEDPQSTAMLLQAIEDYRGAILGESTAGPVETPPNQAEHILQPLNQVQTRPVRQTIHELNLNRNAQEVLNRTAGFRTARKSQNDTSNGSANLTEATDNVLGNLSSLSNNIPINVQNSNDDKNSSSSNKLFPAIAQANTRDLINISSLSNNINTTDPINGAVPSSLINRVTSTNDTDSDRNTNHSHYSVSHSGASREANTTFNHTVPISHTTPANDTAVPSSNSTAPNS